MSRVEAQIIAKVREEAQKYRNFDCPSPSCCGGTQARESSFTEDLEEDVRLSQV